jgi:hypothetical protein
LVKAKIIILPCPVNLCISAAGIQLSPHVAVVALFRAMNIVEIMSKIFFDDNNN